MVTTIIFSASNTHPRSHPVRLNWCKLDRRRRRLPGLWRLGRRLCPIIRICRGCRNQWTNHFGPRRITCLIRCNNKNSSKYKITRILWVRLTFLIIWIIRVCFTHLTTRWLKVYSTKRQIRARVAFRASFRLVDLGLIKDYSRPHIIIITAF